MSATEIRIHDHILYRSVAGGGGMLLDLDRREYFALDDVAARMWEVLSDTGEVLRVVESLALEFDVERSSLQEDVEQFMQTLADRNLVQRSGI
jgi:RNase adaptor protein for sRNA GlmZ degradation